MKAEILTMMRYHLARFEQLGCEFFGISSSFARINRHFATRATYMESGERNGFPQMNCSHRAARLRKKYCSRNDLRQENIF
jgi:hypothetical protein